MTGAGAARADRICVTGGLGFIGRHLCRALVARGYEVVCVDRALGARIGRGAGDSRAVPGVEAVSADVSVDPLGPLLDRIDAVIHLAALPGVRAGHRLADLWRHNVHATARLARALGGRRLVLASTSSVYGNAGRLPTREDSPLRPLNPYAVTKLAAEQAALGEVGRGADVVACRLFTVFGPGQRPDMAFARWIAAIACDRPVPWCAAPRARREFTYVGDAVRGLVAALEHGHSGQVYNLPGSGSTPVRAALAEIERLLGPAARLPVRAETSEALATGACGDKALEELGHAPIVGLREGIERQVEAALPAVAPARRAAA